MDDLAIVPPMDIPSAAKVDSLLSESERQAFDVFETLVGAKSDRGFQAARLADFLGNPGEFSTYLQGSDEERLVRSFHLLRIFRENVELLVHKTWVDQSEDKPKERLLEDLESFIGEYREGDVLAAFRRFVGIARSIPTLLFGAAGRAPDFLDYAFRIDPKFGLFFWYVGELEKQIRTPPSGGDTEELYALETLLGAYVLASF
jgi:hypothetical protein